MAAFHVCRFMLPGRDFHGLAAYVELGETFVWALNALGHEAGLAVNGTRPNAINILMGAQMLGEPQLDALPARTVIYNLEQMARTPLEDLKPVLRSWRSASRSGNSARPTSRSGRRLARARCSTSGSAGRRCSSASRPRRARTSKC